MSFKPIYKLLDWVPIEDLNLQNWDYISENPKGIDLIEKNIDKVHWPSLSLNKNAIHILEKNINKICFDIW